jgi:hypothetical protein
MGNLQQFEDTLISVLENRPERSDVVVVTNQPYDDPYSLRDEVAIVEAPPGAGLLQCFAEGLAASSGGVVHLIAAGIEATPGWADAAIEQFRDRDVAAVAPLVVDRARPRKILSAGLRLTRAGSLLRSAAGCCCDRFKPGDQTFCGPELGFAFYRREALEAIGPVANYGSERADSAELALALLSAGYRCVQAPECVTTATRESLEFPDGWRQGWADERLFLRWEALPSGRRSWPLHWALLAGEVARSPIRPALLGRVAGRLCAALGIGAPREMALGGVAGAKPSSTLTRPPQYSAAKSRAA